MLKENSDRSRPTAQAHSIFHNTLPLDDDPRHIRNTDLSRRQKFPIQIPPPPSCLQHHLTRKKSVHIGHERANASTHTLKILQHAVMKNKNLHDGHSVAERGEPHPKKNTRNEKSPLWLDQFFFLHTSFPRTSQLRCTRDSSVVVFTIVLGHPYVPGHTKGVVRPRTARADMMETLSCGRQEEA